MILPIEIILVKKLKEIGIRLLYLETLLFSNLNLFPTCIIKYLYGFFSKIPSAFKSKLSRLNHPKTEQFQMVLTFGFAGYS